MVEYFLEVSMKIFDVLEVSKKIVDVLEVSMKFLDVLIAVFKKVFDILEVSMESLWYSKSFYGKFLALEVPLKILWLIIFIN